MGIINITNDSFSRDGCLNDKTNYTKKAVKLGLKFIREGADILDIGGESSRPGAVRITAKEEIHRVIPTITRLCKTTKIPISIDTYKPLVAQHALDAGASIINIIKGIAPPKSLMKMISRYGSAVILMHMRGTPRTMQKNIKYNCLLEEMIQSLRNSIENCLDFGIKSDKIIVDPGIGFGKTVENNLEIINHLENFKILNQPILIGTSRKSFIGKILDKEVNQRLFGTIASICVSIFKGAHIVRVHDVKEVYEAVKTTDAIINERIIKEM